jgi:hypothetical protein
MKQEIKEWKWQLPGVKERHGLTAKQVYDELQKIRKDNGGELSPSIIIKCASHEDHPLHNFFKWDDAIAANLWREHEARKLIRDIHVVVISSGQAKDVRAFEVVSKTNSEGNFKSIESLNKSDVAYIKEQCLINLKAWREKISFYNEFKFTVMHLDSAISELKQTRV